MTCRAQYDRTPIEGAPTAGGRVEAALSRRPPRGISSGMEMRSPVGSAPWLPLPKDTSGREPS